LLRLVLRALVWDLHLAILCLQVCFECGSTTHAESEFLVPRERKGLYGLHGCHAG
jgi:hypothetical protein